MAAMVDAERFSVPADGAATATDTRASGRLRIAQIVTALDVGGVPQNVVALARGMRNRHDVTVICGEADRQYAEVLAEAGIDIIQLNLQRGPRPLADIRVLWRLWRLLTAERFDVVHTHRTKAALLGLVAARLAGVPVTVNTAHMLGFMVLRNGLLRRIFWLYDKLLFAIGADAVITVSKSIRSAVIAGGVAPERKVHTLYYGIETEPFAKIASAGGLRRGIGVADDAVVILAVARLAPQKGLDLLIAAAQRVVAVRPQVRLIIAGDGPLRSAVERQIRELKLERHVVLLGNRDDVPALLAAADIFALSSINEGLPIAILEAMAAGKPVVATAVDGIPEAVTSDENGLILRSRDPAEMAAALVRLIDDRPLRERLGRAGRARLERDFSHSRMVAELEALYVALYDQHRPAERRVPQS